MWVDTLRHVSSAPYTSGSGATSSFVTSPTGGGRVSGRVKLEEVPLECSPIRPVSTKRRLPGSPPTVRGRSGGRSVRHQKPRPRNTQSFRLLPPPPPTSTRSRMFVPPFRLKTHSCRRTSSVCLDTSRRSSGTHRLVQGRVACYTPVTDDIPHPWSPQGRPSGPKRLRRTPPTLLPSPTVLSSGNLNIANFIKMSRVA